MEFGTAAWIIISLLVIIILMLILLLINLGNDLERKKVDLERIEESLNSLRREVGNLPESIKKYNKLNI
jgi:hypothetical protein